MQFFHRGWCIYGVGCQRISVEMGTIVTFRRHLDKCKFEKVLRDMGQMGQVQKDILLGQVEWTFTVPFNTATMTA